MQGLPDNAAIAVEAGHCGVFDTRLPIIFLPPCGFPPYQRPRRLL